MKTLTIKQHKVSLIHTLIGLAAITLLALVILRKPKVQSHLSTYEMPMRTNPSAEQRLANALTELEKIPNSDPQLTTKVLEAMEGISASRIGHTPPNGQEPPPLPPNSPQRIRFGVILIAYQEAQLASNTASTKAIALERARTVAQLAKTDFEAAIKLGDVGSSHDVGFVSRGVLEKWIEYQLFTLAQGKVSDVIDTPRGFWIVKRL